MFNDTSTANSTTTYVKVSAHPGLYRHSRSGRYYAFKKLNGKRHECSLKTTDRKIAERRIRDWVRNLDTVDRELEKTTLRELLQKFVAANQGKAAKTKATNASIIAELNRTWPGGIDIEVRDRIIAESPFSTIQTSWKRPQEPIRLVPTADQFKAIVNSIRSQRFTAHANQTADFVEFLGLAGLGQAEAAS